MYDPDRCRFARSHEWAFKDGGAAVVGISDHAQKEITDVVFVELPKAGRQVKAGEACSIVESVKAAFDIYAPLSGEIVAVNADVAKDPAVVNASPHERGWLFKIKVADGKGWDALMDLAAYEAFLKSGAAH